MIMRADIGTLSSPILFLEPAVSPNGMNCTSPSIDAVIDEDY